jgi:membrane protease YdiL (CAAX protease family)
MENKIYPKIKNAILLCLLLIGIQFGIGFIIGIIQSLTGISDESIITGVLYIFTSLISFGIVLLVGFKKTKRTLNEVFKFNKVPPVLWGFATIITIGLSIVGSEIDNLLQLVLPMPVWVANIFDSLITGQPLIISLIYIGLIAGFCEEFLFRGLILDGFTKNYSKRKAIFISSLLFGLIHLNPWQLVPAFFIGLVLAWICIETKSLFLCIYMHFLNNAGAVIMYRLNNVIPIKGYNVTTTELQPVWFTLSGLVLLSIGMFLFFKEFNKSNTLP